MARILIIEDSSLNMELVTVLLSTFGHVLFQADRALLGIEIAHQLPLDLILMDINMPGVNGIEAAGMLRAHPETRNIPLIALTALAMAGDRERILAAGFDEYIAKPFDHEAFLETIARYAKHSYAPAPPTIAPPTK